jgi:hypothetical protein
VEVIHSFDESRQRRCVNQNSGDGSVVANRRFNHPNAPVAQINLSFRIPGGLRANRKLFTWMSNRLLGH